MHIDIKESLAATKIVAIVRGIREEQADDVAEALYLGGVRLVEVTMNTEGALAIIARWRKRFAGRLFVGAGTVLNIDLADEASRAGAQFLVTPNTDAQVLAYAAERELAIFPGAMTPTEIVAAWRLGATAVKVFPAGAVGPSYFKELQGPLAHIPLMATGGINLENVDQYVNAGARYVGLGSSLVNKSMIENGRFEELAEHAQSFVKAVNRLS